MKKTKKRGFTIVELVIVIAVIAILAAVMVPTFSNVIAKAKDARILEEARGAWDEAYANHVLNDKGTLAANDGIFAYSNGAGADHKYFFKVNNGALATIVNTQAATESKDCIVTIVDGFSVSKLDVPATN